MLPRPTTGVKSQEQTYSRGCRRNENVRNRPAHPHAMRLSRLASTALRSYPQTSAEQMRAHLLLPLGHAMNVLQHAYQLRGRNNPLKQPAAQFQHACLLPAMTSRLACTTYKGTVAGVSVDARQCAAPTQNTSLSRSNHMCTAGNLSICWSTT